MRIGWILAFSVTFAATIIISAYNNQKVEGFIGIVSVMHVAITIYYNFSKTVEAPSFLIRNQTNDLESETSESFDTFKGLQSPRLTDEEVRVRFDQLKSYVSTGKNQSANIFTDGNLKPLILCSLIRLTNSLSFYFGTWLLLIMLSQEYQVYFPIYLWIGLLCGTVTIFIVYRFKHLTYLIVVILGVAYAPGFLGGPDVVASMLKVVSLIALMIFLWCFPMPLEMIGMAHLTEAFPIAKKPFSVAFVLASEFVVNILFALYILHVLDDLYLFGGILFTIFLCIYFVIYLFVPRNTGNSSLEECANIYKSLF